MKHSGGMKMALYDPLTREQIRAVIEGRKATPRVPVMAHFWVNPGVFGERETQIRSILERYPSDIESAFIRIPSVYEAPDDDPSYRWSPQGSVPQSSSYDNAGCISDMETDLEPLLDDFPSAEYSGLVPDIPDSDGRYRLACWWYFFFERFWSLRGIESALTDFYEYPDKVHELFGMLCRFYCRMLERVYEKWQPDGVFTSDDLGTQTSTFFSLSMFDEFFAPYYKRVIDKAHSLGMHFWLHSCGNIEAFLPRFIELGIDVIHPIQTYTMNERKVSSQFGDRITIWSGFDVQRVIPYGTPEDVRREVRRLTDAYARPEGRFMLTLGNAATPDTPPSSLESLLDEAIQYSAKKFTRIRK